MACVCTDALRSFGIATTYDARIRTPSGTFADRGQAGVALNERGPGSPADFSGGIISGGDIGFRPESRDR
jgi:hypothetical protein